MVWTDIAKFLEFYLDSVPQIFGWYHIISLLLIIGISVIIGIFFGKKRNGGKFKTYKKIFLVVWIINVFFEVYKQIIITFPSSGDYFYRWWAFPFFICSFPLYMMPIAIFTKNEKIRRLMDYFLATYVLFSGAIVICYPAIVFNNLMFLNVQTIICHGSQVIIGVYLYASGRVRFSVTNDYSFNLKDFINVTLLFLATFILSQLLHVIHRSLGLHLIHGCDLTIFHVSPYYTTPLPILSIIHEKLGYIALIFAFPLSMIITAYLTYSIAFSMQLLLKNEKLPLMRKIKSNSNKKNYE